MSDRQVAAWLAAGFVTILVTALIWRRAGSSSAAGSPYPLLERSMRAALALGVGALLGLGVFLLLAGLNR